MESDFLAKAIIKRNEYLFKTEELFVANKKGWFSNFAVHFKSVCARIRKLQDESFLSTISYLNYQMLYTNFIKRKYIAEVFVYNGKSYLDKNQCFIGEYDISFLFTFFDWLWNDLINMKKRYIGLVSARDIIAFMMQTLPDFYSYLVNIARFAILECTDKSPFAEITISDEFMVKVGDYMAKTEIVYTERKYKDANELSKWFNERLVKKYIFGDYSNLDFSGKEFSFMDFRYARFKSSTLKYTNFEGSSLIGVNFRNAIMEGCCLDNCSLSEADFSNAKLKNTSFRNARAKIRSSNRTNWKFVGFLPACFCGADLTNADFTGADLADADFTGAILTNTVFTDAILTGAIFDGINIKG